MKKIYLSALCLAVASGLNAQVTSAQLAPKTSVFGHEKISNYNNFEKAVLWSNDVSVASDWAFTNNSSPAQDWYIETDPNAVPTYAPVVTATASNGFLMIDSDAAGASATQDAYATYTGALDFTGEPNITLEFDHHFRAFQETRSVDVSNDGGTTWTTFEVTPSTLANVNVTETFSIDISSVAGNQSNVSIRFHYEGSFGWYWAVDDILVKTTELYDLRADGNVWGVTGSWGARLPYYSTPVDQIQPIEFCGINSNIGVNDIADATYTIDIPSVFNSTGTINSVSGAVDTICATATFTPNATAASYVASASMSTASNTEPVVTNNDFVDINLDVTDFIYARDNANNVIEGGSYNQGNGFESGNVFDIFTDAEITGVEVGIASTAVVDAVIYVKLYTIDPTTGDFILEDQSLPYTLQAGDIGNFISLPLLGGAYLLTAGETYLVTVGTDGDGGLTNDLVVMTSGSSEAQTTFYYDATDLTWYYSTSTSAVRMDFSPASINENENVFGMGVYPNPANANANVTFSLNNTADVNITVTDLSGKVVYTDALGNVAAGTTEVSLNTASLSEGVYMINVAANNAVSTQKLVIRK
ncbi:MAG: T9SS type A sorting domain-containing protein [Flavobacteriales bacterium]|nr:T9SS type A sorting domain-containing protein [Flavobacteriales bacterium]